MFAVDGEEPSMSLSPDSEAGLAGLKAVSGSEAVELGADEPSEGKPGERTPKSGGSMVAGSIVEAEDTATRGADMVTAGGKSLAVVAIGILFNVTIQLGASPCPAIAFGTLEALLGAEAAVFAPRPPFASSAPDSPIGAT